MKKSRLHHNICSFFYHWVPAFLIDCLLFCIGYPPVYDFSLKLSLLNPKINFFFIKVCAEFRDVFRRDSKCLNIMPIINGILIIQIFCIWGRWSMTLKRRNMLYKMMVTFYFMIFEFYVKLLEVWIFWESLIKFLDRTNSFFIFSIFLTASR